MEEKFKLGNFKVVRVNAVIGYYNNIKDKQSQIRDNKKYFSKFRVEMEVQAKNPKSYIVCNDNYNIGEIYRRHSGHISIIPFIKDNNIYYEVKDCQNLNIYCFYKFDTEYEYKDGNKKIRELIKEDKIPYWLADNREKIESVFLPSKHFNYTKDIEWIKD